MNFTGNLQAVDNAGAGRTDVSLKPDVSGLTSLQIAQTSTTSGAFTSTNNTAFTTGAGTGFYYGGASGSLVGQNTISSTGAFTGTLFALTADSTQTGTILGISGQSLTTGKAIDVSLGAAYNLTGNDSTGQRAGAVNVRAGAYNGNIFNVLSTANTGATTMNLANLESGQTDGQLLKIKTNGVYVGSANTGIVNIDANTATGGTIARISATSLTGASQALSIALGAGSAATTAILVNSNAAFAGTLVDLQSNSASQFKVDATGTTVAGNLLGSNAAAFSIDATALKNINIGGTNAATLNLGRSGQIQALLGNVTVAGTLGVTGATTLSSTLAVTGNTTLSGTLTGPAAAVFSIDAGGAQNINVGGTTATTLNLGRSGQTQALLGNATVAGTLAVTGATTFTGNTTHGGTITGPAAAVFAIDSGGLNNINIGGVNAATLNLGRSGQIQALLGNVTIAGTVTGPASGAFTIDNGNGSAINIAGVTATTLNLSRTGQTTNVLGNLTVAGNLTITSIGHILTQTTLVPTPTSNTGTTCTIVTNGTDTAGQLQVVTTSGLGANQVMCTITFASAYSGYGPTVIITPAETNSAGLANTKAPFVSSVSTTAWTLKSNGTSMGAATYIWNYIVIR